MRRILNQSGHVYAECMLLSRIYTHPGGIFLACSLAISIRTQLLPYISNSRLKTSHAENEKQHQNHYRQLYQPDALFRHVKQNIILFYCCYLLFRFNDRVAWIRNGSIIQWTGFIIIRRCPPSARGFAG